MNECTDVLPGVARSFRPCLAQAHKDGTVTYRRTFRAQHDGYLKVGDKVSERGVKNRGMGGGVDRCRPEPCSFVFYGGEGDQPVPRHNSVQFAS